MMLQFPWPPKELHSHAKGHWRPKAEATAKYRRDAWVIALAAKVQCNPNAVITITYHPPDLRRRDCQNMPHAMKPLIDGIAQAMGCDDNGFRVRYPDMFGSVVKGGAIVVEIND